MRNMKFRKTIAIAAVMVISVLMLAGCAGGNSISGKWYPVTAEPATAAGSIEFNSGGEFVTDGIEGDWQEEDGVVQINVFGIHEVYNVGDYEGYTVLCKEGSQWPSYCHSAEDAKAVYDIMYEQ